ncbi:MAG: galactokinase [Planctomycetota bacterium]|jgi:galactokinase
MPRRAVQVDRRDVARLVAHGRAAFVARFGRPPTMAAAAPGRVNLIGDHTDYNDGLVLPAAIDRHVVVVADRARADHSTLASLAIDDEQRLSLGAPPPADGGWARYPAGVAALLGETGRRPPELDLLVASTLPLGAGLASSAALTVATAVLLRHVTRRRVDDAALARLCRDVEHCFAGTRCGLMDQLAILDAVPGAARLIDCRTGTGSAIRLPAGVAVLVVDTGVVRALAGSAYGDRRRDCEVTARAVGVRALRDATLADLAAAGLPDAARRRAAHVITENTRVLLAAVALERGDGPEAGRLMHASHASLRDLLEVSCPELDTVVDTAAALGPAGGVLGARLTGAGFGGCAIVLCRTGTRPEVARRIEGAFAARHGRRPAVFPVRAVGGARMVAC